MDKGLYLPLQTTLESLAPEDIARILDAEAAVNNWFKAVREHANQAVQAGQVQIPGYGFQEGRRSYAWKDEATAVAAMSAAGINDPYKRELHSPAQAKKMLAEDRHPMLDVAIEVTRAAPSLKRIKGEGKPMFAPATESTPTPAPTLSNNGW